MAKQNGATRRNVKRTIRYVRSTRTPLFLSSVCCVTLYFYRHVPTRFPDDQRVAPTVRCERETKNAMHFWGPFLTGNRLFSLRKHKSRGTSCRLPPLVWKNLRSLKVSLCRHITICLQLPHTDMRIMPRGAPVLAFWNAPGPAREKKIYTRASQRPCFRLLRNRLGNAITTCSSEISSSPRASYQTIVLPNWLRRCLYPSITPIGGKQPLQVSRSGRSRLPVSLFLTSQRRRVKRHLSIINTFFSAFHWIASHWIVFLNFLWVFWFPIVLSWPDLNWCLLSHWAINVGRTLTRNRISF